MLIKEKVEGLELPPCFKSFCPKCGWQGRAAGGFVFVRGVCPIAPNLDTPVPDVMARCPLCATAVHCLMDLEPLVARYKWALAHLFAIEGRGTDLFPCSCKPEPSCLVEGEPKVDMCIMGDTCFCCDETWLRVLGSAKCNGCYAVSRIALLEKHPARNFPDWIYYETVKERNKCHL